MAMSWGKRSKTAAQVSRIDGSFFDVQSQVSTSIITQKTSVTDGFSRDKKNELLRGCAEATAPCNTPFHLTVQFFNGTF
jgi:hypothetical protein